MSQEPTPRCPQCNSPLPAHSPQGLCPRCLMSMNLADPTRVTGDGTQNTSSPGPLPGTPSPEDIAKFFPHLEILECLGRGGMGVVYKARQPRLNRLVALKILAPEREKDPAFATRFEKEAQALARLSHPNIVTIHDFGQAGGMCFLLMEYVDGVTLRQLLETGRVSAREALAIVPQICDALQFAHDQGIVHRDIKPENLLMDRLGRVKVADFGIAKILEAKNTSAEGSSVSKQTSTTSPQLTEPGQVAGTPSYMAPEQRDRPSEVDHRADIYALGVVFYQMLTGELPGKHLEPPSRKVRIDVRLDEVVLRALEASPELRFQQVSEVRTMVENIVQGENENYNPLDNKDKQPSPQQHPIPPSRFSRTAIVGAAWAGAGLFSVVPLLFTTFAQDQPSLAGFWRAFLDFNAYPGGPVMGPLGCLGVVIATILGWVAVFQIRRSEGRLGGLWLAVFDGLLFPLLALDVALVAAFGAGRDTTNVWLLPFLVDLFVVQAVWDSVNTGGKASASRTSFKSLWNPLLSSPIEQEIRDHMSASEKREMLMRGLMFGVWNSATWFLPVFFIFMVSSPGHWLYAALAFGLGLAGYPVWWKILREGLCSTAWARERGYTHEHLKKSAKALHTPLRARIVGAIAFGVALVSFPLALANAGWPKPIAKAVAAFGTVSLCLIYLYAMKIYALWCSRLTEGPAMENEAHWRNPDNWTGPVYFSKRDSRVWVPKKNRALGWTLNLGRAGGLVVMTGLLLAALIISPTAVAYFVAKEKAPAAKPAETHPAPSAPNHAADPKARKSQPPATAKP